jgi:hypothetical protein
MQGLARRPSPKLRQPLVQQVKTALPPVHGLNSTGAVASMPEGDAINMDNVLSTDLGVMVREGWREYATNIGGDATHEVRTIMSYEGAPAISTASPLAQSTLFGVIDQGIFKIEGGGNLAALAPMMALSGSIDAGRMSFVQFTTDSGQYLWACSETDGAYLYNGTAWMKCTSVGGPGPGIITGVDPANFVQVCVWKKRVMFIVRGGSACWILDVGAVGGVAKKFDFGPQLLHGGAVLGLANWTQDDGAGVDDRLVILGSSGDLVIYEGTDPTDATKFANIGTWFIGQPPVGRRCFTQSGGNVYILTEFGVIPVNLIVQGGLDNLLTSDTAQISQLRKLQSELNDNFQTLLNVKGWELMSLPSKALLHIARPSTSSTEHVQYAFQWHNLAWSRFLDVPGATFGRRLSEVYAGTVDGRVLRILDGFTDGKKLNGTGAQEVRARLTPAFSYMGNPAVRTQALMMRCNFLTAVEPAYSLVMNVDFQLNPASGNAIAGPAIGSLWDQAFWDAANWAGGASSFAEWRGVEGLGYALAPTIFISAQTRTVLASIEYMTKDGGPL